MTLRYGIIGAGMMGREHIRNLAALHGVDGVAIDVVAVADPDEGSRARTRRACGDHFSPEIVADASDVLARDDVDAVVVATPNHTHAAVMAQVFETDKHVMIEKPLATTLADAREIHVRAEAHAGVVWMGLEYRYMAPVAALLARLDAVGTVRMCAIREHRFPFLKKVGNWNRFSENTGGTLVEKCCHFFDLMNLVTRSEPVRVFASGAQDVNHLDERYDGRVPDILDNAYVVVDYASGARASLDLCMFAEGSRDEQQLVVTGDVGRLETTVPGDALYLSRRAQNAHERIVVPRDARVREEGLHHGSSYLEHLGFRDAITRGTAAAVTTRDGLRSVALGLAAHASIERGEVVRLDESLEVVP